MPILKVLAPKSEQKHVLESSKLVERYDAFVVVDATKSAAEKLARKYLVEDISSHYALRFATHEKAKTVKPRSKYRGEKGLGRGPHHYVVQFAGPVKTAWLSKVAKLATLRGPHGDFSQIVRARESTLPRIAALPFVRWIGHLPHAARIAPSGELPRTMPRDGVYSVEVFDGSDTGRIASAARGLGFQILDRQPRARLLIVAAHGKKPSVKKLSAVHGVRMIRSRVAKRTCNDVATVIMGNTWSATSSNGLGLTGAGETVAVCDTGLDSGDPQNIHPDFAGRIVAMKSYPMTPDWFSVVTNPGADDGPGDFDSGHGTHTTGSVCGNGSASSKAIRGHAHQAKLVFQAIEQEMKWKPNAPAKLKKERYMLAGIPTDMRALFQFAYTNGARVHSNSWGGGDPGAYDDQCEQFDQFVWDNKDICFVIAAGNDGTDKDGDGKINLGSVSSPGTAKNCITVGACENHRPDFDSETYGQWWPDDFPVNPSVNDPMADNPDQVVAFSSRGPCSDGRIKPEVVAPGTFILSTRSTRLAPNNFAWSAYPTNKNYFFMGGTSMATPLTAGAVTLVRQFLRTEQKIKSPSAALVKAVLVAGAVRLPKTAPSGTLLDNHQGFGRVNLDRSLKKPLLTVDGAGLKTGQSASQTIQVPSGAKTLRVVLSYTDFPGPTLVNNLNLVVTDPSGKRYAGNLGAVGGVVTFDSKNNTELVQVSKPKAGTWKIDVVASNVSKGPQDYALAAVLV